MARSPAESVIINGLVNLGYLISKTDANIRVSEDTLKRIGHKSIPFTDGNGYYAELGVFHELHCLVCALF